MDDRRVEGKTDSTGSEVAAYLRNIRSELIADVTDQYDARYTYSKGYTMPREVRDAWTSSFIDGVIADLEGNVNPHRYESCGGDMVLMCEKSMLPIATYLEAELFHARIVASYIWRHWLGEPGAVKRANEALEASIRASLQANVRVFLDTICEPGTISTILSLNTPSGPWAQGGLSAHGHLPSHADAPGHDVASDRASSPQRGVNATGLTSREREVLDLVVRGMANKEIASMLGMGLSTVKKHVSRLFDKFGVTSRAELVAAALGARPET